MSERTADDVEAPKLTGPRATQLKVATVHEGFSEYSKGSIARCSHLRGRRTEYASHAVANAMLRGPLRSLRNDRMPRAYGS